MAGQVPTRLGDGRRDQGIGSAGEDQFGGPREPPKACRARRRVAVARSHRLVQGNVLDLEIGRVGQGTCPLAFQLEIQLLQPLATTHQRDFSAGGLGLRQGLEGHFGTDAGGIPEGQGQSGWIYPWGGTLGRVGIHGALVFAGINDVVVRDGLSARLDHRPLGQDGRGSPSTHR